MVFLFLLFILLYSYDIVSSVGRFFLSMESYAKYVKGGCWMQYLVFGMLLLLGAIVSGAYLYISHKKNQVSATVLLSSCGIKREGEKIESISVSHTLEIEGEEKKQIVTDKIPVQELNGAVLTLQYDEAIGEVVPSEYTQYLPFVCGFALSGVLCFLAYFCGEFAFIKMLSELELLAVLAAVIAVIAFSYVCVLINPAVVRAKGKYEGVMQSGDREEVVQVYSLWYGEHMQYAIRTKGMPVKTDKEKTVTLLYNTKTGTVSRLNELVFSLSFSALAFAGMLILLL